MLKRYAARLPATLSGARNAVARALRDKPALEVGNRSKDVEHQLASRRRRIDAFLEAAQVNITASEVHSTVEEFLERAPEAAGSAACGAVDNPGCSIKPYQVFIGASIEHERTFGLDHAVGADQCLRHDGETQCEMRKAKVGPGALCHRDGLRGNSDRPVRVRGDAEVGLERRGR